VTVDKTTAEIDEVGNSMPKIIAEIREITLELPWMLQPEVFIPKLSDFIFYIIVAAGFSLRFTSSDGCM
jgi:hypothetical protein